MELAIRETNTAEEAEAAMRFVARIADFVQPFGHPTRLRVAAWAYGHPEEPFSPKMMADVLGESLGTVAYHVRTMLRHGLIRLVKEKQRRGAMEHFYVLTAAGYRAIEGAGRIVAVDAELSPTERRLALPAGAVG